MLYYDIVDRFTALSDSNRRKIIELLASRGPLSASEISEQFSVSAPAISQHLKVLREAQLVRVEKRAQQRIYSIDLDAILEVEEWVQQVTQLWSQRFDALARFLEAEKKRTMTDKTERDQQDAKPENR